jgi:LmbE family N-acetylglucosaminyl deacetylase
MPVLIVVAHPDDEVLGCGGYAAMLAAAGHEVRSCILCASADERARRPDTGQLIRDTSRAQQILGLREPILGQFPNLRLNAVPHVELVQFIEKSMRETGSTVLITHHPADLNDDHLHTSRACQAASRLFQRVPDVPRLKALYFMEVLSSSDWAFGGNGDHFEPDSYVEIGEKNLNLKIEALAAYQDVMRPFPHPRSEEVLRGLAAFRGGQSGMHFAEAFQTAFHALDVR